MINKKTESAAKELSAKDFQQLYGMGRYLSCAAVENTPLKITADAGLIRIQFHYHNVPSKAAVFIDGKFQ